MTCAYGWAASATAARTTKASLPKSGAQPGTKDIDREARESRGPTPRILAAAAATIRAWIRGRIRGRPVASCWASQFDPTRQQLSGLARAETVDWSFGRNRT